MQRTASVESNPAAVHREPADWWSHSPPTTSQPVCQP